MINHVRNLLLNIDGAKTPGMSFFGEQYVDPDFKAKELPSYLQLFREKLFGAKPDRHMLNYRLHQYLSLIHATELETYVTQKDNRVTYLNVTRPEIFDSATYAPSLVRTTAGGPLNILTGASTYETFDAVGDWNLGNGWAISGGTLNKATGTGFGVTDWDNHPPEPFDALTEYTVELEIVSVTQTPTFQMMGSATTDLGALGTGVHTFNVTTGSTTGQPIRIVGSNTEGLTLDNLWVFKAGQDNQRADAVYGVPSAPDGLGKMQWQYRLTRDNTDYTLQLIPGTGAQSQSLPGDNIIDVGQTGYRIQVNNINADTYRFDVLLRPQWDLGQIALLLENLGEPNYIKLFGAAPAEPYRTFKNLWESNEALPYRLGAFLLAVAYRTDEIAD